MGSRPAFQSRFSWMSVRILQARGKPGSSHARPSCKSLPVGRPGWWLALVILAQCPVHAGGEWFQIKNKDSEPHTIWVYEKFRSYEDRPTIFGRVNKETTRDVDRDRFWVHVPARSGTGPGQAGFNPGYDINWFGLSNYDHISRIRVDNGEAVECDKLAGYVKTTADGLNHWIRDHGYIPTSGTGGGERGIQIPRTFVINNGVISVE